MASRRNAVVQKEDKSDQTAGVSNPVGKRVAEDSPEKPTTKKRPAFGDLTNAKGIPVIGKILLRVSKKSEIKPLRKSRTNKEEKEFDTKSTKSLDNELSPAESVKNSQESLPNNEENLLYVTFRESLSDLPVQSSKADSIEKTTSLPPPGVDDFDRESLNDPFSEPRYAMDIFNYYKEREANFPMEKYMARQPELSKGMRAVLADWLVEVQESFELNHETLYMAIKLVDHYLKKKTLPKAQLQLLGATATFLACKFDERCPPLIDDFLYICDDAYTRQQLIRMEIDLIKTLDFDLGIPLSYRFLRRFARCTKVSMEVLTLARYILETSLMEYDLIVERDSMMAAAALHLALRMKGHPKWTPAMCYYSGYEESEILDLERKLNRVITSPTYKNLATVRTKYSHKIFLEVAKIPTVPMDEIVAL